MKKIVLILAGGSGLRAGGDMPKQFHPLYGKPLLWWSMKAFMDADPEMHLILVLHPDYIQLWKSLETTLNEDERFPYIAAYGGKNRSDSVRNGIMKISDIIDQGEDAIVMIHDGARPMVTPEMIQRGMKSLRIGEGRIPAIKAISSLRRLTDSRKSLNNTDSESVDRANYVEVQTPQIFHYSTIAGAYDRVANTDSFTDDASLAEASGVRIMLYEGETDNIKVTHPDDFLICEALLERRNHLCSK